MTAPNTTVSSNLSNLSNMTENGINPKIAYFAKFERFASGAMNSIVLGSAAPFCLVDMYLYFGGNCYFHFRGGIVGQACK